MATSPAPEAEAGRPDVLIVMHDLRGGGAERVTIRLAEAMADAGRRVEIVTFSDENVYAGDLSGRVPVTSLHAKRVAGGIGKLSAHIRARRPRSVLAAMTHVNLATIAATRLARLQGGERLRLLVVEHNTMSQKIASAKRPAAKLAYRLVPYAYRLADVVACGGQGMADDLRRVSGLPEGKVRTLYNPVVSPDLPEQAKAPVGHPWFRKGQPPVLLGVGRLHPQKDFPTLLRAFARVRAVRPSRLVILGEGEERKALEALVKELGVGEDVSMPGFAANPYAHLSRAGAFVLSSRWEGLPTVMIEALACGAPVVSTDCPSGPQEILGGGRLGPLVAMGDDAALAGAILETLAAPPDPAAGRARAQDFAVAPSAKAYLDALGV